VAVDAKKVYLPDINQPVMFAGGQPVYMDLEWYEALQALVDLANATKAEVDTQHP